METSTLVEVISLFIGTGGLAGFIVAMLTIRSERRKAKGEAHSAEYEGMKVEQDTYQELIIDLKEAWKEQKDYIGELTEDRRNLRNERNELRKEIDELKEEFRRDQDKNEREKHEMREEFQAKIHELNDKIARQGHIIESWKPLICVKVDCPQREKNIMGLVADDSFDTKEERSGEGAQ
jgi:chromosome segregation ATPase